MRSRARSSAAACARCSAWTCPSIPSDASRTARRRTTHDARSSPQTRPGIANISTHSTPDARIRALRPPKPLVDPWQAHGVLLEEERTPIGLERALTIFLAGAECPFTCSFCDLWRYTIDGPTPPGALPRQIDETLASLDVARVARIKLYNASNFFDRRAVPLEDLPRIAESCGHFGGVTVESHARTINREAVAFARRLESAGGGRLEVAMGRGTVHPAAAPDYEQL